MKNKMKKERKRLMKTILKSMIALILCAVTIIAGISTGTGIADAASKKVPLKVTFNGKTVNLINDLKTSEGRGEGDSPKISEVKKKWGNPSKKKKEGYVTRYTWKKGKSSIEINDYETKNGEVGGVQIDIKDKNASVFGVKVGMKKATALQKIKKAIGKKPKTSSDGGDMLILTGDYGFFDYMPLSIGLKNGKVSSISWFRS